MFEIQNNILLYKQSGGKAHPTSCNRENVTQQIQFEQN